VVAVVADSEAVDSEAVDSEAVDLEEAEVADLEEVIVGEVVVVEGPLEELAHLVQLQALGEVLILMVIIDHIADITDHHGGIIDLGITDGGIPHGGRDITIVPGIIALFMLVGE
jgi:hypothetical protein